MFGKKKYSICRSRRLYFFIFFLRRGAVYGILKVFKKKRKEYAAALADTLRKGWTDMHGHSPEDMFKLGFGLMRLPKLKDGSIDVEQVKEMADLFIAGGGTYFDTAYVYDGGAAEEAFRKAVVERYPRDAYTVCTKMNAWLGHPDEETTRKQFQISLERTGAGFFDFYLLHALQPDNIEIYNKYGLWDFVKEQRDKGLIKHWGFSFHATPEDLDKLLTDHPDVDYVQLQINYADWNSASVQSGKCYEVARAHNKPIVVMEPVKGGTLADPPKKVAELFKAADPNASFASWAIRYVASLPGIMTVLSGMSSVEQMKDNLRYMKDFKPLTEDEKALVEKAREIIENDISIACTACHYCTDGCPMQIPIPEIFKVYNSNLLNRNNPRAKKAYKEATEGKGKASDCVRCGQCEGACPQQLPIMSLLEECTDMEKEWKR